MMIVLSAGLTWKIRTLIVVVAGLVPVGYQIWRMGYYALPYPNTAVSKDAGGAKWAQGFAYLWNLVGPYLLWLPLLFLLIGALLLVWRSRADTPTATADQPARPLWQRFQQFLRTPRAIVTFILGSGLILGIYSLRVGGDFMHGRVLLPVLFCLLIPVAVIPLRVPARAAFGSNRDTAIFGVSAVLWIGTIIWAFFAANTTGMPEGSVVGRSGIVDERAFYALNTGHKHPILAEDYLDYPRMRAMVETIARTPEGGLLLPSASSRRRPDRPRQESLSGLGGRGHGNDRRSTVAAVLPRRRLGCGRKAGHHLPGNAGVAHVVPLRADLGQIQTELPAGIRLREVPIRPGSRLRIGTLRSRSTGFTQVM